jgi:hypothetical protein
MERDEPKSAASGSCRVGGSNGARERVMANRRNRILDGQTVEVVPIATSEYRETCVKVLANALIGGQGYKAANAVKDAFDAMAVVLVGDRQLFHRKPHVAGGESDDQAY